MTDALADTLPIPFRIPPGIHLVRVNKTTGLPVRAGEGNWILEAFKPGTVPTRASELLDGSDAPGVGDGQAPATGTGGLY